jgi:TRAP-type C4-dicarboxylate transport system permease small subunit
MEPLKNKIIWFVRALGVLGMVAIAAIMLIMGVDVILRYFFNRPLLWSYDTTEYLMVGCTYFGIAYTEWQEGHVNISILFSRCSPRIQLVLNMINRLIMLALAIFISERGLRLTIDSWQVGRTAVGAVKIPEAPVDATIFIGGIALSLLIILKLVGYVQQFRALETRAS